MERCLICEVLEDAVQVLAVVLGLIFYIKFTDLDQPSLSMSACKLGDSVKVLQSGPVWDEYNLNGCSVSPESMPATPVREPFDSCIGNISSPPHIHFQLGDINPFGKMFGTLDDKEDVRHKCNTSALYAIDAMDNTMEHSQEQHSAKKFQWYFGAVGTGPEDPFHNATVYHNSAAPHALPMAFDLW